MTDPNASPAGWYPDADDFGTERWWGGTAWTSTTRPRSTPAQAPPVPVPAEVTVPPGGWYPDPQNPAVEKWFDGSAWTQMTRERVGHQYAAAPGQPVSAPGKWRFRWVWPNSAEARAFKNPLHHPVVGIVVGLLFLAFGLYGGFSSIAPANMSATITGTVTDVNLSEGGTTSRNGRVSPPSCSPVAGFVVGGKQYTASSSAGVSPCPWALGQPIAVTYDPSSPAKAMIPTEGTARFMPWLVGGMGGLLAAGCSYALVRRRRAKG